MRIPSLNNQHFMERIGDFFLNVAQNIIRNLNQNFHHQKDTGRRWNMLELLLGSL